MLRFISVYDDSDGVHARMLSMLYVVGVSFYKAAGLEPPLFRLQGFQVFEPPPLFPAAFSQNEG